MIHPFLNILQYEKYMKKLYIKVTCCYSSNMTNSYLFYIQKGNMIIGELNAK